MGSDLHVDAGLGILDRKPLERIPVMGDGALLDDLAVFVEDANRV
jgi:hypothetical protein